MKNNKGITLIALVITIIVMLILVGVTITVALQGGLFSSARRAATGTEAAKEEEMLAASGTYGGKTIQEWVKGENSESNEGTTIEQSTEVGGKILYSYDGTKANEKAWTVIQNNGSTIKIASPDAIGSLTLGGEYAETVGDLDEDGTSNTSLDKAIYSYNNAEDIIDNYCATVVTNPNKISVRSINALDAKMTVNSVDNNSLLTDADLNIIPLEDIWYKLDNSVICKGLWGEENSSLFWRMEFYWIPAKRAYREDNPTVNQYGLKASVACQFIDDGPTIVDDELRSVMGFRYADLLIKYTDSYDSIGTGTWEALSASYRCLASCRNTNSCIIRKYII